MTRRWSAIAAALMMVGCSNPGEKAEEQFRMVEQANPSPDDLCDASRKVADGYLEARDQERYASWKNKADINCMNARLGSQLGTR
ncbi:hypothetical protein CA235_07475 [Sphingomonas sp. ABOLF]|uniref:hypothetical protein n=1 Tax=Sphingomonas sp. ABOLF TaxID=1985879 RepID=UPI000F7DB7F2|nr:hypothetical protein [Sphingomonas sp. ABOLF]RSV15683.1 hypothetical protein CA235_07475 [Sphingomonas sp. ABOLF]